MSAYLCDPDTFDLLAEAIRRWKVDLHSDDLYGRTQYREMAATLYVENVKSVRYRYDDWGPVETYTCRPVDMDEAAIAIRPEDLVLASVRCLRYQSCEHPDYRESLAARILDAIEHEAIHRLTSDAPWGYTRAWSAERKATIKGEIHESLHTH
jgi:hypothetical protein